MRARPPFRNEALCRRDQFLFINGVAKLRKLGANFVFCLLCLDWLAVDDLAIKTFSAGSVALQVNLGRTNLISSSFDLHNIQDPEEKEVAQRRLDCRKHLLEMRSRNADITDPESGGQTVMQQEDLQVCYLIFVFKLPAKI